jgi:hypothetical protein
MQHPKNTWVQVAIGNGFSEKTVQRSFPKVSERFKNEDKKTTSWRGFGIETAASVNIYPVIICDINEFCQ